MQTTERANAEPSVIIGLITTAVASVIALLVAFGIDLNPSQQLGVLGIIAGVGPLVVALFTRGKVVALQNVVALVDPAGAVVAGPALLTVADGQPVAVVSNLPLLPQE